MKKLYFTLVIFLYAFVPFGQDECDSSFCSNHAPMDSFEIIADSAIREGNQTINTVMISCRMRCAIEDARSTTENVTIQYGTYTILVFAREAIILKEDE